MNKIYTETLPSGFAFQMNLIPGGAFDMGSADDDMEALANEKPQRSGVLVAPYYLAPYAVTQAFWKALMGENNNPSGFRGDQRPVERVSWYDTQEFIKRLNAETKATRSAFGVGLYRLPTEVEWEYAARGGSVDVRHLYVGSDKLKEVGWFIHNSDEETHEVGLLMPNQLDLYDMSGNVLEWVEDHWHEDYRGAPNDGQAWLSIDKDTSRVLRGGNFLRVPQACRSSFRSHYASNYRFVGIGFRLALSSSSG